MCCYQEFGWNPDDIKRLSETEGLLLSVYFEELAAFNGEQRKKQENDHPTNAGDGWTDDLVMDGDQDDEEDIAWESSM